QITVVARCLHERLPRHVDQQQTQRARRLALAPASLRIPPLLRRIERAEPGGSLSSIGGEGRGRGGRLLSIKFRQDIGRGTQSAGRPLSGPRFFSLGIARASKQSE